MDANTTPASTTPATAEMLEGCRCGCGTSMEGRKANYLPGHDARHASRVAKAMAASADTNTWGDIAEGMNLISPALITKAVRAADRIQTKQAAKDGRSRTAKKATATNHDGYITGEVKIGRWTYPARKWEGGVIERNTKRDGSGEWIPDSGIFQG